MGVQLIGQLGWIIIPSMKNHTVNDTVPPQADVAAVRHEVRRALALIGGKWKLEILWLLNQRMHRFNELRRAIPGVTQHMLTAQLRDLEADGFVERTVYAQVPPRVEYRITAEALRLRSVFDALIRWASPAREPGSPPGSSAAALQGGGAIGPSGHRPDEVQSRPLARGRIKKIRQAL
jgi:DNA-binding HxlR family transcriptional regulator